MLKIEAVFLNFFEFFLWLMAMLIVRVWVFECEAPPLSVLYYSMYNNFFSLIIIRAPWLSQYVRRFSCCRPGFKSRRGRGRFLVTQSDRPTLSYVFVLNVFDSRRRRFLVTQSDRSTFRIGLNGCVRLENDKVNSEIGSRTYNAFFVIAIVRL